MIFFLFSVDIPGSSLQHHTAHANRSNGYTSSRKGSRRKVIEIVAEAITTDLGQGHYTVIHAARFRHTDVAFAKGKTNNILSLSLSMRHSRVVPNRRHLGGILAIYLITTQIILLCKVKKF